MRTGHETVRIRPSLTLNLLKHLISIPSVNPAIEEGQGEQAIGEFIADWFRRTGEFHVSEQRVARDRFNVVAVLVGKGDGNSLMLNGHMDTVGASNMTVDPFRPCTKNGRIYGRGSCDMKGPIAAMMSAMLALAKSNKRLAGDVLFTAVVDEEALSLGMSALINRFRADAAIVGEPTHMDIAVAHKGYAWFEIETTGKRAHGSVPERGADAIEKMAKIIFQLDSIRSRHKTKKHPLVGTPRIHTSTIAGGSDWSTVPAKCVLRLERRLIPGEDTREALTELRNAVERCIMHDSTLRAEVRMIHHADSMQVDANAPHITVLRKNVRQLCGRGKIVGVPYWTDASILVNQAGIPSCLFGPGDISVAHGQEEYIQADDVLTASKIYAKAALDYCNRENYCESP